MDEGSQDRTRARLRREQCQARRLGLTVEQLRHRRRAADVLAGLRGTLHRPVAPGPRARREP